MQDHRGYRTPIPVLRRFTRGDLELNLRDATLACDPPRLSEAVSAWIADRFEGNRTAAEGAATRRLVRALGVAGFARWPEGEKAAFRALALLFAQIPGLARWPERDRRALLALMRAKATDEMSFQRRVARLRRLRAALVEMIAQRPA
jgi:hypothetical protein